MMEGSLSFVRVNSTELLKVQSVLWKVIFPRNWAFTQSKSWYKAKGVGIKNYYKQQQYFLHVLAINNVAVR